MPPHARSWSRLIAHADMDAFYAAVEQLDDPRLRGRPILVGGNSRRGVVLTASYEARPSGARSAMSMERARRLCPDALIVPPRFDRYRELSEAIMTVFGSFSPVVEALSLDEAFIDLSGTEHLFGDPASIGRRLKAAVREATGGLTVSVGLSGTKYVAKVASDYGKPDGLTLVPPETARAWLAPLPVSRLWTVGPKLQARLEARGFRTVGDVACAGLDELTEAFGSAGPRLHALANAEDPRQVVRGRGQKSVGADRTLETDVSRRADICLQLHHSADAIGRRLRRKGLLARGVRVKLKTTRFEVLTRQRHLPEPTDLAETLYRHGADLLDAFDHPGPFRLVGMAAFDLLRTSDPHQADLFQTDGARRRLETTLDALAERFGADVVHRAVDIGQRQGARGGPNLDFLDEHGEGA